MSFLRHQEIYPSDGDASGRAGIPTHRLDEFPAGYSSTGCSPTLPASASPTGSDYALRSSCWSIVFQRSANSVLTVCLSPGAKFIGMQLTELLQHTRESVGLELATLDFLEMQIEEVRKRLEAILQVSAEADLLQTLPYVGPILSAVMALEIGRVGRFPSAAHLASYAGLVPRVNSSSGHTRLGQICGDVNRYLKWAFIETRNLVVIHQKHLIGRHVVRLYQRVKRKRNHQKAFVAVARHKDYEHTFVDAGVSAAPAIALEADH